MRCCVGGRGWPSSTPVRALEARAASASITLLTHCCCCRACPAGEDAPLATGARPEENGYATPGVWTRVEASEQRKQFGAYEVWRRIQAARTAPRVPSVLLSVSDEAFATWLTAGQVSWLRQYRDTLTQLSDWHAERLRPTLREPFDSLDLDGCVAEIDAMHTSPSSCLCLPPRGVLTGAAACDCRNGTVDAAELRELLEIHLGQPITATELRRALHQLDRNGDGVIEFDEFLFWKARQEALRQLGLARGGGLGLAVEAALVSLAAARREVEARAQRTAVRFEGQRLVPGTLVPQVRSSAPLHGAHPPHPLKHAHVRCPWVCVAADKRPRL